MYSFPNKGFDRVLLRTRLNRKFNEFTKQVDNIVVIGHYDDLRIINVVTPDMGTIIKKYTSLVEVKTTSKKYMWGAEIRAAVRQLQLYMFLMKEELEKQGFPLWKRGYVEIYSQKTGCLMKRIPVEYDEHVEEWIRHVYKCFAGLEKVSAPIPKICKFCPKNIRDSCDWNFLMKKNKMKVDI